MIDPYADLTITQLRAPSLIASTYTSTAIDTTGSKARDLLIVISAGTVTDGTHTWEIQECDTSDGEYTAVADAHLSGTEPAVITTNDERRFIIAYRGFKRYIKVVNTVTGSPSTGGVFGVLLVWARLQAVPVTHAT